jgi:HD-GYP domain-containing protein (c-di-GMP phosphodiesterase class II)
MSELAAEQALRYAEELRELYGGERAQRRRAEDALRRLEGSYAATVRALAVALELRDDLTGGHAERVTDLALRLTERVAPALAADPELEYGFLLHDVGKIGVPDAILLKPGPLEPEERVAIEQHSLHGARILEQVPHLGGLAHAIVVSHHERWDGGGYPYGTAGEDIPLAARIFAVADAFDAMTQDRPYRRALPVNDALAEIEAQSGVQFDPALVEPFLALIAERERGA